MLDQLTMKITRRAALVAVAVLLALGVSAPALAAPNPVFGPTLGQLKKSSVPILLPSYIPVSKAYADVITVTRKVYEVEIAAAPQCHEATACTVGYVRGEKPSAALAKLPGKSISLTHGLIGHFVNFSCGASCGDSSLAWVEKGYLYTFGLHAGSLKHLRKMANSAINNGPQ